MLRIKHRDIRDKQGHANLFVVLGLGEGIKMKVILSDNNVLKIPKEEIDGATAPIYLVGLPGDTAKLKALIEGKL
tara:strand:+ start:131 stop:355 length:225 start_codon:yes stop_codon:yes gene_type:complete